MKWPHEMAENLNIFLVEDNDLDVEILKRGLKKTGVTGSLVRARDGVEALELLTKDLSTQTLPRPYIILLDINMPRMNGHEFLEILRSSEALAGIRVVVFTTSDSQTDVELAYKNNASAYIVKPNGPSDMQNIVKSISDFWSICESSDPT